jgi:hypothetical protein
MTNINNRGFVGFFFGLAFLLSACGSNSNNDTRDESLRGTGNRDGGDSDSSAGENGACTREELRATVDDYYAALEAHDASTLSLASDVKYTENGQTVKVGGGLWKTAGALKFKRSALDTETCNAVTESTIEEEGEEANSDIILGLRIKLADDEITEVEAIIVRSTSDYPLFDAAGLVATADDDWETPIATAKRPTRDELATFIDKYLTVFPDGACNFSDDCMRTENGGTLASCTDPDIGVGCPDPNATSSDMGMPVRLSVLDVDAGIAVGFTIFSGLVLKGPYDDFHMLKVRDGQVVGVHAILAPGSSSGWE